MWIRGICTELPASEKRLVGAFLPNAMALASASAMFVED